MAKKILVVDDDERIGDLLRKALSREGFEVQISSDGAHALELVKKISPDLIVLDWVMPGMDGEAVAAKLSSDEATKKIPVIFITGAISEDEIVRCEGKIGDRIFMSKASDVMDLVKKIRKLVGR